MTTETYNKATILLQQIDKVTTLEKRLQRVYDDYKINKDENLFDVLRQCGEALSVLKEIDQQKLKTL